VLILNWPLETSSLSENVIAHCLSRVCVAALRLLHRTAAQTVHEGHRSAVADLPQIFRRCIRRDAEYS